MTAEAEAASGQAEPSRKHARRERRATRLAWAVAGAVAVVLVVVAAVLLWPRPSGVETVEVAGVAYTTNVAVEETGGYVYAYLPVNADVADVLLAVEDAGDSATIREFLDGLDTLVPGEYVVDLTHGSLHVIVDGIADED